MSTRPCAFGILLLATASGFTTDLPGDSGESAVARSPVAVEGLADFVEPLADFVDEGAAGAAHVVFRAEDVLPVEGRCGVDDNDLSVWGPCA